MAALQITRTVSIDEDELEWSFVRSGGPGGQHVNTSATKAELRFDVGRSPSLSGSQREQAVLRLGRRLTADGVLVVQASQFRSQARNRDDARRRLAGLLREALAPPPPARRATRPTAAARRRRLDAKRRRGDTKVLRRRPED